MPSISIAIVRALIAVLFFSEAANAFPGEGGEFEMTTYYVGFLYRGPGWTAQSTPESVRLQDAHMANIRRMAESGQLVVAGPFSDDGDLRGLYIFRVGTKEEAEALVRSDPAVRAGRLRFELHPWFAAKNIVVTAHASTPVPAGVRP